MSRTYLRRRLAVGAVLVTVLVVLVLLVQGGSSSRRTGVVGSAATRDTGSTAVGAPTTATLPAVRAVSVTRSALPLVDATRPVTHDGVVLSTSRHLSTQVWTPTGSGPFPLVVFAAGYDKGPLDYDRFCTVLASSGYVVAAPSFPLEDPAQGHTLDRADIPGEATDVAFVITQLEQRSATLHLLPSRIGVVGHSDGADVALLVAYGTTTRDARVTSVVAEAPDPMAGPTPPSSVPLLLVQGTNDSVVPYSASGTVFGQVDAPVTYLTLVRADHFPPIAGGTPWTPVLDGAVADFFDVTLAGRGPGPASLVAQLSSSPLAKVEAKG